MGWEVALHEEYAWDWSWPPGCATLRSLPRRDRYPLDFVAAACATQLRIRANRDLVFEQHEEFAGIHRRPLYRDLDLRAMDLTREKDFGAPRSQPRSVSAYAEYFIRLPVPATLRWHREAPERAELDFAWLRVAGANPMSLRRVERAPDDLAVDASRWARDLGAGSVEEAAGEGRLFEVDHSSLAGVQTGSYLGRRKYLCGSRSLFTTLNGPLRPVAIQLTPSRRVFMPGDGIAWSMAKYFAQVADANVHEAMEHLASTHLVMGAVGGATRRTLAKDHPLRTLIEPHLVGTFAINESAKRNLVAPDGVVDRVFAPRIDVAASLIRAALDGFMLQDRAPTKELRARGVDDPETLPEYPYRDDVLLVYATTRRFVDAYVRLYYRDDSQVFNDASLASWVDEIGSPLGGALRGLRPVQTVEALVTLLSNILHTASAQHAALNFPQYDCFGWAAIVAGACWGPPPGDDPTEGDLLALMPPWDCLILQVERVFQLAGIRYRRLGDYAFADRRAAAAAAAFRRELGDVERAIRARDALRPHSYPYLLPSAIPPSINI